MYDVLTAREYTDTYGTKKAYFTNIGRMFANKNGEGFTALLNALPMPGPDGQAKLILKVSQPRDQQGGGYQNQQQQRQQNSVPAAATPASAFPDFDDEIPF